MWEEPQATLSDRAHLAIRKDIVSGNLAPGTRLRIAKLSKDYDIGASPLREALSKLSSEFLVNFEAQRGFSVAPVSAQDLRDISQIRCDLESEAVARAIAPCAACCPASRAAPGSPSTQLWYVIRRIHFLKAM